MRKEKDVKQKQKYTLTRAEERAIAKENRRAMKHFEALKARKNVKESEYLTQMHDPKNIVEFDNLHTYFYTDAGVVKAVDGVSFDIPRGSTVCVVGESGCGKSVTSLSLMQLVQAPQGQNPLQRGRQSLQRRKNADRGDAQNPRQGHHDDLSGADDEPESDFYHRKPIRRGLGPASGLR